MYRFGQELMDVYAKPIISNPDTAKDYIEKCKQSLYPITGITVLGTVIIYVIFYIVFDRPVRQERVERLHAAEECLLILSGGSYFERILKKSDSETSSVNPQALEFFKDAAINDRRECLQMGEEIIQARTARAQRRQQVLAKRCGDGSNVSLECQAWRADKKRKQ